MGDRYYITVICPNCNYKENEVYFAPTCNIDKWNCSQCGEQIDLCDYTGISYKDASNANLIGEIINSIK